MVDAAADNAGALAGTLPCRYLVPELIAAKVFETLMGPSHDSQIMLFQRFRDFLSSIDPSSYETELTVCQFTRVELNS